MRPEKRQHERMPLPAAALISDSVKVCEGDVVDVSVGGMAVERVPSSMLKKLPKNFSAVVSSGGSNAKVTMAPKWFKREASGVYFTVGFKVVGPSDAWHTLIKRTAASVDSLIRKKAIDPWASARNVRAA